MVFFTRLRCYSTHRHHHRRLFIDCQCHLRTPGGESQNLQRAIDVGAARRGDSITRDGAVSSRSGDNTPYAVRRPYEGMPDRTRQGRFWCLWAFSICSVLGMLCYRLAIARLRRLHECVSDYTSVPVERYTTQCERKDETEGGREKGGDRG